ncbi:unnamed protein product, partial [marine sediment metagenome]
AEMAREMYRELEKRSEWFYSEDAEREIRKELYKLLSKKFKETPSYRGSEKETPIYVIQSKGLVDRVLSMHKILASEGK